MDMPDLYYWVATIWILYQMSENFFARLIRKFKRRLKRKSPKPKRKRKGKRRK